MTNQPWIVSEWLAASLERRCRFTGCEFESRAIRLTDFDRPVVLTKAAGLFLSPLSWLEPPCPALPL